MFYGQVSRSRNYIYKMRCLELNSIIVIFVDDTTLLVTNKNSVVESNNLRRSLLDLQTWLSTSK